MRLPRYYKIQLNRKRTVPGGCDYLQPPLKAEGNSATQTLVR